LSQAQTFVGKRVWAKGRIVEAANVDRLVVESPSDIHIRPSN